MSMLNRIAHLQLFPYIGTQTLGLSFFFVSSSPSSFVLKNLMFRAFPWAWRSPPVTSIRHLVVGSFQCVLSPNRTPLWVHVFHTHVVGTRNQWFLYYIYVSTVVMDFHFIDNLIHIFKCVKIYLLQGLKGLVFVAASKEVAYFFLPFSLRGGGCDIACVELWVGELGRTEHRVHIARSTADAHPHPIIYDPPSTYYIQYLIYTYIKKPQPANVGSSQSAAAVLYFPSPFLNITHIHNTRNGVHRH